MMGQTSNTIKSSYQKQLVENTNIHLNIVMNLEVIDKPMVTSDERGRKRILLVVEPIGRGHSVQFDILRLLSSELLDHYDVSIASSYIDEGKANHLTSIGVHVISSLRFSFFRSMLKASRLENESTLWLGSWFGGTLLNSNEKIISSLIKNKRFDTIVNLTNTIPVVCDLWWSQGIPLYLTLSKIGENNRYARLATRYFSGIIEKADMKLLRRIRQGSRKFVVISKYQYNFYEEMGFAPDGIIHTFNDFSKFIPSKERGIESYVLTYISKETDFFVLRGMAANGIKVVGFGSKIPAGTNVSELSNYVDFRGFVETSELIRLYSNALFTAFPFTIEVLGLVPLESMACGTPVLTYNEQGPGETVLNERTGWLVGSRDEFIKKSAELWQGSNFLKNSDIRQQCVERVREFSVERAIRELSKFIG